MLTVRHLSSFMMLSALQQHQLTFTIPYPVAKSFEHASQLATLLVAAIGSATSSVCVCVYALLSCIFIKQHIIQTYNTS